jgi:hypothetical protein
LNYIMLTKQYTLGSDKPLKCVMTIASWRR